MRKCFGIITIVLIIVLCCCMTGCDFIADISSLMGESNAFKTIIKHIDENSLYGTDAIFNMTDTCNLIAGYTDDGNTLIFSPYVTTMTTENKFVLYLAKGESKFKWEFTFSEYVMRGEGNRSSFFGTTEKLTYSYTNAPSYLKEGMSTTAATNLDLTLTCINSEFRSLGVTVYDLGFVYY